MLIDPRRLPILLAVQREGGIVAAADVLQISPSAVSQQIQRLEDEVGLELVERTPTGAILTPAGRVLAHSAERIEVELAETMNSLRPLAGQVTGIVTIGAFQTVLRAVLLPFLNAVAEILPGVEVRIEEVEEARGMSLLRSGHLDVLLLERDTMGARAPSGYVDTPLMDEPWVVITPASSPPIGSMHDLTQLRWLRMSPGLTGTAPLARITSTVGELTFVDFSYWTYEAALSLVAAGIGSTILPSMAVSDLHSEDVQIIPLPALGTRHVLVRHHREDLDDPGAVGQTLAALLEHVTRSGQE
ncbi:MAG: LysR family transcriptional regulator [Actinomycetaceae bacterium]|nr:LysR family transcriptional regulator [Actinomycetaceae bacterium]